MAAFNRRTVTIADGEVALIEFGDPARPIDVVFSHANGFNAMCHRAALEPLADRLHMVAIDQRGHGRTRLPANPEGRTSWWSLSDDLIAVVDALRITGPTVFAGHSMGGTISLMSAERLGGRLKALALFDPVVPTKLWTPDKPQPDYLLGLAEMTRRRRDRFANREEAMNGYRGRGIFKTWPEGSIADYLEDGLTPEGDGVGLSCAPAWEAANFTAQSQPVRKLLGETRWPTRVLRAEIASTCTVLPEDPEAADNANVRMEIIEGTTHMLPIERPDLVQTALLDAVRG